VEQLNQLRRRLREEKISYHVVKNTLMKLASKGTELEKLRDYFEGPTGDCHLLWRPYPLGKDLSRVHKIPTCLEIKVGLIQGKVTTPQEVKSLATMPSREVLMAQVLGGIQMPGGQLAGVIQNALQQVPGVIQARVDQLAKIESGE